MGRGRSQKSRDLVRQARAILEEIQPASVRAVCYQLFVRGLIAGMDKANTNRVGARLTRGPWLTTAEMEVRMGGGVTCVRALPYLPTSSPDE